MKKKLNPMGKNGKILLCSSCGAYRHLMAKCTESWENKVKTMTHQSNKQELKGDINFRGREHSALGERCNVSTLDEVTEEVTNLNEELITLKGEIIEIKADSLKDLKRQKEDGDNHTKILGQETENLQKKISITINEIQHRIFKLEAALETGLINEWTESKGPRFAVCLAEVTTRPDLPADVSLDALVRVLWAAGTFTLKNIRVLNAGVSPG